MKKIAALIEQGKMSVDLLTPEEQKEFAQYLSQISGFCNKLPQWIPWWELPLGHSGIEEVGSVSQMEDYKTTDLNELNEFDEYQKDDPVPEGKGEDSEEKEEKEEMEEMEEKEEKEEKEDKPQNKSRVGAESRTRGEVMRYRLMALPSLKSLYTGIVNPAVRYHLVNALYPFVFYYRFYNGGVNDDARYIVGCCLTASDVLSGSVRLPTICTLDMAVSAAQEGTIKVFVSISTTFLW